MTAAAERRGTRFATLLMLAPAGFLTLLIFAQPLAMIVRMSFNPWEPPRFYVDGRTLDHYRRILSDPVVHDAIVNSLAIAFATAIITVVIAYALAFHIWAHSGRWRLAIIGLMLFPLLISEISIIFGWWVFLPKNGLLSYVLTRLHLIAEPVSLLYHTLTALIGLVYIILPFSFFILLSTFQRLDRQHLEASADLGAPAWTTFREVLLPQTLTGVILALSQAFIWAIGIYATPRALGPDTLWTIGGMVEDQMIGRSNWPMASALATVMIILIVAALAATQLLDRRSAR